MENISMDRNTVIEFIKNNVKSETVHYEIYEELIEVILKIIPLLGHYEEEDKKFNFKIALGMDNNKSSLLASSYVLKRCYWEEGDTKEKRIHKIENMIKKVAIFCERNADIFLIQRENEIECGIYFSKLWTTSVTKTSFTKEKFIIFQHLCGNKVLATAQNNTICICMDFDKSIEIKNTDNKAVCNTDIYRKWEDIFGKIKRVIHGTICLIVDENWNPQEDHNFTNDIELTDLDLSTNIEPNIDDIQDYGNKMEMFLAMLNYDGITIIDTNEKIRAYNLFCRVDSCDEIIGGARHRAYNYLKNLSEEKRCGYIAIYFQSQEGEVEFYCFPKRGNDKNTERKFSSFDASIMVPEDERLKLQDKNLKETYEEFRKKGLKEAEKIEDDDSNTYHEMNSLVDDLEEAHNGINNFYREPTPAEKLSQYISNNMDKTLKILEKYCDIRRKLLNIVIECSIGNAYGASWGAQMYLQQIIGNIPENIWKEYFANDEYLDISLLWIISIPGLNEKWKSILDIIRKGNPNIKEIIDDKDYEPKKYRRLYDILTIEDDSDEIIL